MHVTIICHGTRYSLIVEQNIIYPPQLPRRITPKELQEHTKLIMERFVGTLEELAKD